MVDSPSVVRTSCSPCGRTATRYVPAESLAGDEIVLFNAGPDVVEWKEDGGFIARPVFNRRMDDLFYGVRDTDDGECGDGS